MNIDWARSALLATAASALLGCAGTDDVPIAQDNVPIASGPAAIVARLPKADQGLVKLDCYTVDPYQPIKIAKPDPKASTQASAFLGAWGAGAWDGRVCHDLWVMDVDAAGNVVMFDAHGPGYRNEATAFLRKGVIEPDGRIHVRKGGAMVTYWIENGVLYGERETGTSHARIVMLKKS